MAPRTSPSVLAALGALPLLLLPLLLLLLLQAGGAEAATRYSCVIYGNNVPTSVKNQIDNDAGSLLQTFRNKEGAGYTSVAAGGSARYLATDGESKIENENENEEEGHQDRELIDCPNSCSNSGSNYCRALGCAYCGACNRRDLMHLRGLVGATSAASVEAAMNAELAAYCNGVSGCSLWAKLYVVNANGSVSPAT